MDVFDCSMSKKPYQKSRFKKAVSKKSLELTTLLEKGYA